MIQQLKDILLDIVTEIDLGDHSSAMRGIARFTILFDRFLLENKEYIFVREIEILNLCMYRMLEYMERNNLAGLRELITDSFICFLDNWDFKNNINLVYIQ